MVNQVLKIRTRAAAFVLVWFLLFCGCAHNLRVAGSTLHHDGLEREFILYQPSFAEI